jgi:hypothetical protein
MTPTLHDQVAERLALGEPLGDLAGHAATCPSCQQLIGVSSQLSATRSAVDPGLGFSARMTAGAQHRVAARRHRRLAVGLAASVASGAFGVFLVTHTATERPYVQAPPMVAHQPDTPDRAEPAEPASDDELTALVGFADVERSARAAAHWGHIEKPLAAYRKLLKGVEP